MSRRRRVERHWAVSSVPNIFQRKAPHNTLRTGTAERVFTQIRQNPGSFAAIFFWAPQITADRGSPRVSLEAEEIKEALAGHVDAALLPSTRKLPEWLATLKDALTAKCCVGDASGERGAAQ